jgi:prepilin signal peptidase PulO-like enzyme (type II secretory pathway)
MVVVPLLVLTAALVALCAIDVEHLLLPNRVVYPTGFIVVPLFALSSAVDDEWTSLGRAAIGGVVAFAVFYAIWFAAPKAMGFGDVRLSFILGFASAYFGWSTLGLALFLPFLLGSVGGIAIAAPIVLAPMTLGAVVGYLNGVSVMRSYQGEEPLHPTQARLVIAAVFAVMLGSVVYLVLSAMRRVERGRHIPFGPYLAAGAMIAIFV